MSARPLILLLLLLSPGVNAADRAGEVLFSRGVVTAYSEGGTARIVARGSELLIGDVVSTGSGSATIFELDDGTRISLRPDSTFEITAFNLATNQENAIFTLFKGGLRAVTGYLSKRNRNAVRLRTPIATIGIRGTEFDARLCGDDCIGEALLRPEAAGRAGFVRGRVMARSPGGRARLLERNAPVYAGDTLLTDGSAYAVVAFRDDSRVTLLPNTEFRVDELRFQPSEPERGRAVFRLLRGGLRAVSGLIGKRNPRLYRMRTAVATIGIRGTSYDLVCVGSCQNPAPDAGPDGDGLFTEVWDGSIVIDDVTPIDSGAVVFIGNTGATPIPVPELPQPITQPLPTAVEMPAPPPPPASSATPSAGLYLSCYSGECAMQGDANEVTLSAGEAAFIGEAGGTAQALEEIPPFQAEDPVLRVLEVGGTFNQLNQVLESGVGECTAP